MSELFVTDSKALLINQPILRLDTPLGQLVFDFQCNHQSLVNVTPQKIECIQNKSFISSWITQNAQVEFLRVDINPKIPSDMKVDKCFAGVWRVKALSNNIFFTFKCCLKSTIPEGLTGNPETGEGLIAETWENDSTILSIGTEDEDFLIQRAECQEMLPGRFLNLIKSEAIEILDNGIKVILPELISQEVAQIHFVVAWTAKTNHPASTWFAVDQSPSEILMNALVR